MKVELNTMTAEQITDAIFELPAEKFLLVMQILGKRAEQLQRRGEQVARRKSEGDFRSFLEGDER